MYSELYDMLKSVGITKVKHLDQFEYDEYGYLDSNKYPWVRYLGLAVVERYDKIMHNICEKEYMSLFIHTDNQLNKKEPNRLKNYINLSCFFPHNLLYVCGNMHTYHDDICHTKDNIVHLDIPYDFLFLLLKLKPAINANLLYVLPRYIRSYDDYFDYAGHLSTYYYYGKKNNIFQIFNSSSNFDELSTCNNLAITSNFLRNARVEDFVEIILSNENEFAEYRRALNKKLNKKDLRYSDIYDWLQEIDYNVAKVNILYKNKMKDLRFKGMEVALGTVANVGLLMLPEELSAIKPYASTLISTKTGFDCVGFIHELRNAQNLGRENDFWVLWKTLK